MVMTHSTHAVSRSLLVLGLIGGFLAAQPSLKELQPKIDAAIHRGVDALLRAQEDDGTWNLNPYAYPVGPTALCTYTLLKCGLLPKHPGVAKALAYLEKNLSNKTYGAACQLMALEATHDPKYKPQMKQLLRRLIDWQKGGFGYPGRAVDMSNTQYAALGLRAARLSGLKIPRDVVLDLAKETMEHKEKAKQLDLPPVPMKDDEYARSNRGKVAGFKYRKAGNRKATGSMTTAGLGILIICRDLLDKKKAPRIINKRIAAAIDEGMNWMRVHWAVDGNPNAGRSWHYYYLYGLERVGDLLRSDVLAGRAWYREGADLLVKRQNKGDGTWGNANDTSFALLFLKRATWQGGLTATAGTGRAQRVYLAAADKADVKLRGAGNPVMSLWIAGFNNKRLQKRFPKVKGKKSGVRVASVQYLVDGEVIHEALAGTKDTWDGEPFPYQHRFRKRGRHSVSARIHAINPATDSAEADTVILESPIMIVEVQDLADSRADAIRDELMDSLFITRTLKVKYSTKERGDPGGRRPWISDGRLSTEWVCKPDDKNPWIRIELERMLNVRRLTLWPAHRIAANGENHIDTIKEIEVYVNKKRRPHVLTNATDGKNPIRLAFKRRTGIKTLEIRITKRTTSKHQKGKAGFREITVSK